MGSLYLDKTLWGVKKVKDSECIQPEGNFAEPTSVKRIRERDKQTM